MDGCMELGSTQAVGGNNIAHENPAFLRDISRTSVQFPMICSQVRCNFTLPAQPHALPPAYPNVAQSK